MTHRLATNYAKNYCNRTTIVKVIVENVVTCFFGTQCRNERLTKMQKLKDVVKLGQCNLAERFVGRVPVNTYTTNTNQQHDYITVTD